METVALKQQLSSLQEQQIQKDKLIKQAESLASERRHGISVGWVIAAAVIGILIGWIIANR
jgi:hypothetical protein